MNTPRAAAERGREYINDVLAINQIHGMRSISSAAGLKAAIDAATRQAQQFERIARK
ncbi:Uncharacterised protein [Mycobacteroides abscessus subsp. abscessus]|uniref:hypothetical protein n=1 Tax=Mycobacteroides abscessus TaxID=36809 RepID=UPI000927142B|nr:hypothetical protein [Mycobacteroides abscessus]SIC07237.1 Uncharacterised protein [Mycobacteroides abscessus subsp. abscessus]